MKKVRKEERNKGRKEERNEEKNEEILYRHGLQSLKKENCFNSSTEKLEIDSADFLKGQKKKGRGQETVRLKTRCTTFRPTEMEVRKPCIKTA
ncbi:hypothetical protein ANN_11723 [Periplaneta americana]|uniref:Uncharacterized protein n=1 Tax=Periplaneta americana TaxID=6978 RepID=A0ABQ8T6I5_PERAM|nr:hypothetical protein ANN_11723 [Periplaneta americana]